MNTQLNQSENWDEVYDFRQKNPGKPIKGFPGAVTVIPFPKMYGGQKYEIILRNSEKHTAQVDDHREFMSEGLEWKTLGENKIGNVEHYNVVAWKLL
jgi:hypothetical protein